MHGQIIGMIVAKRKSVATGKRCLLRGLVIGVLTPTNVTKTMNHFETVFEIIYSGEMTTCYDEPMSATTCFLCQIVFVLKFECLICFFDKANPFKEPVRLFL